MAFNSREEGRRRINELIGQIQEAKEDFEAELSPPGQVPLSQQPSTSTQGTSRVEPSTSRIPENSRKRGIEDSESPEDKKRRLEGTQGHEKDSDGTPGEDEMEQAEPVNPNKEQALGGKLALGIDQGLAVVYNTLPVSGSLFNSVKGTPAQPSEGENRKDPASEDEMEEAEPPKLVKRNRLSMGQEEDSDDSTQKDRSPDAGSLGEDEMEEAGDISEYEEDADDRVVDDGNSGREAGPSGSEDSGDSEDSEAPRRRASDSEESEGSEDSGDSDDSGDSEGSEAPRRGASEDVPDVDLEDPMRPAPRYSITITHFLENPEVYLENPSFELELTTLVDKHAKSMKIGEYEEEEYPEDLDEPLDLSMRMDPEEEDGGENDEGQGSGNSFQSGGWNKTMPSEEMDLLKRILSCKVKVPATERRSGGKRTQSESEALIAVFNVFKSPNKKACEMIGKQIGMSPETVRKWFKNKRCKRTKNTPLNFVKGEGLN